MNWAYKIVIASVLFIGYIVFLVVKCFQQDISLVDEHYYKEEIEYQAQIQKIRNANLSNDLSIKYVGASNEVALRFSKENKVEGKVRLFRPSDDKMDKTIQLKPDNSGLQIIPTGQLAKGLWKVKVSWTDGKSEFFKEEVLIL